MLKRIGPSGLLAIVIGCLASTVFAQGGTAVINGTVFDPAKAVLPGVTVTVTNEATGISREAISGPEGHFVVPTLMPGTYTIRTALTGFQGQTREGIVLNIGQELTIDLSMSLAGVAEQVVVTGESPIIETTASRIGSVVSEQEIDQLPSQGRNHLSLMQLVPGLVPELTPGEFEGGNFNVNGRTTASNLWTVDGAANQDTDGGGTGPQAANGNSTANTRWGVGASGSASLTQSTSLFRIAGCQACDRANVIGSHSISPGRGVGLTSEPTRLPSAFAI